MTSTPIFSVVIPTCERPEALRECLACLTSSYPDDATDNFEIIVSSDSTIPEQVETKQTVSFQLLTGPKKGPAANRNFGAKHASGQWLLFLDDDCRPDPDWIDGFAAAIAAHPQINVFEGRTYVATPRQSFWEVSPANEHGGYLWSCNFAIRRSLFEELGGFDEHFPYAAMEDVELRYRLQKRNESFLFVPQAAVEHPWRKRSATSFARQRESTLIYLRLHPEESANLSSRSFIYAATYGFCKNTLPALLHGNWSGIDALFREQISQLQLALTIFLRRI